MAVRAFLRDVVTIQRVYRSRASIGPGGTRVVTGILRASYSATANIVGRSAMIAEIGLLRLRARGRALLYGAVWEGEEQHPGRPVGGAIRAVTKKSIPKIVRETEQRWTALLRAA